MNASSSIAIVPAAVKPGTAGALMTANVLTVPPTMPVEALAGLLAERHVSGVPVVNAEGTLLGLVTEADLIRRLAGAEERPGGFFSTLFGNPERLAESYARTHGLVAADVMTPAPLATVTEDATAAEITRLMEERRVRRVPVLRDGKLIGLVSRADLLRAVLGGAGHGTSLDDARTAEEVRARIRKEPWTDSYWSSVSVKDGVVTLHGFVRSNEVRRGLRVLAAGVPGVQRVEDRMEVLPFYIYGYGGV